MRRILTSVLFPPESPIVNPLNVVRPLTGGQISPTCHESLPDFENVTAAKNCKHCVLKKSGELSGRKKEETGVGLLKDER